MGQVLGQGRWDRDAIAYFARVQADGGVIISDVDVNNAIKHAKFNGYWASVVFWTSAQFGVKKDGANAVSVLYDLKGNDASQGTGSAQPIWTANQQNGRAVLVFDGSDDYLLMSGTFSINETILTGKMLSFGASRAFYSCRASASGLTPNSNELIIVATAEAITTNLDGISTEAFFNGIESPYTPPIANYPNGRNLGDLSEFFVFSLSYSSVSGTKYMVIGCDTYIAAGMRTVNAQYGDLIFAGIDISDAQRESIESFQNQKWQIY